MQYSITPMVFSGLPGWRLRFGQAQLDICQQGGQILNYFPDLGAPPVIWLSEQAEFIKGQPVRGGCPSVGHGLAIESVILQTFKL